MTFRPDGFLLLFELQILAGHGKIGTLVGRDPLTQSAISLLGQEWFDDRNCASEIHPGIANLIEIDGSNSFILETVLNRWACHQLLGTHHLPVYFCGPHGEIMRTLSQIFSISPRARDQFWRDFDPQTATVDGFAQAFIDMNASNERHQYIYEDTSIVRPLEKRTMRLATKANSKTAFEAISDEEIEHFVGWTVCVREVDWIYSAEIVLQKAFSVFQSESTLLPKTINSRRPGRPNERAQVLANFHQAFPNGMGGVSISEVARRVGYDRKTTRAALLEAGKLDFGRNKSGQKF